MRLIVKKRDGSTLTELTLADDAKVSDVTAAIHKAKPKYYPSRQRLTFDKGGKANAKVLETGKSLADYEIKDGDYILFKDLGQQIGWRTVFVIEYLGPILIHVLLYSLAPVIYGQGFEPTSQQKLTFYLSIAHFAKREYETFFVHRFSLETMPIYNLPKNCAHYWLSALWIAVVTYRPGFHGVWPVQFNDLGNYFLLFVWAWAEVSNYATHVTLRNLRPEGSKVRHIPRGYGFNLVSVPNYLFEIVGWIAFSMLNGSLAAWAFTVLGAAQMYLWAVKKHKRYRKEFGNEYPKGRKILIPYLL
ncbi:3-oxo-5-alpha-steroid 4-dehydrogenase-domain-containing protein [Polychytrium aggregatum]|uniref:3-oxo-5-alpha-steroid 4-dehydrogenase-domain-containing protein n=1 Tax=Polychytrium aggregatum TaxID=110093 RepID=UPI0022FDDD5B|nr:3-oxo-5-alpha-steroid 4-dehydrogenase-domain-containing protein [Polychytrium aggregatum]KAI9208541.1 3-oxo-5-alpha-steroid 4-dehydrogenase-domain-containing protein [Polychytrium aggregatum]